MDRIDLHVEVPRPRTSVLATNRAGEESSAAVAERVAKALSLQRDRQGCVDALLESGQIDDHCRLASEDRRFLESAAEKLALSPRAIHRVLKVARTIADLDEAKSIEGNHLAEALGFRANWGRHSAVTA